MGVFYDEESEEVKREIDKLIALHSHVTRIADIEYMIYYLGCSEEEFWNKYIWRRSSFDF